MMEVSQEAITSVMKRHPKDKGALIHLLQDIQTELRHLPPEAMRSAAEYLDVPLSKVYAVSTFYKAFSLVPQGRTMVRVCCGTACHVRGAAHLVEEAETKLGIKPGETTEDLDFTLETVNCVGACAMAPVVVVNGEFHANVFQTEMDKIMRDGGADATR